MKSEMLAKSPLLALPLGALFFFLFVFLAVLVVTMRRRSYDVVARLPLELDDDAHAPDSIEREGRK